MTERTNLDTASSLPMQEVLADLTADGPVHLEPDERLWKLYIFRPASGRATHLEHRIYSMLKPDGQLALVTFAVHRPNGGPSVRSGIARVPDLTQTHLNLIIDKIRQQSHADDYDYDEVDLSHLSTLSEQLAYLQQL
jgi:hypothetical protein